MILTARPNLCRRRGIRVRVGFCTMMSRHSTRVIGTVFLVCILTACGSAAAQISPLSRNRSERANRSCVPTGVCLDAAGHSFDVGNMPLATVLSPEGDRLILSLSGWREQGLEVVDWKTGHVVQNLPQAGAFLGLVFSPDGKTLFASGGNEDAVFR